MKLDHDFFVARYRALGTDELFEQLHGVELSDTALAALTAVLVERGMSDDDMLARHRAATRTRIPSARAQNLCDNCGRSLAGGMIEDCGSRLCSAECVRGMRIFDRSNPSARSMSSLSSFIRSRQMSSAIFTSAALRGTNTIRSW